MSNKVPLTIHSGDTKLELPVRPGLGFLAVCLKHATPIEFDCKEADCGICLIEVESGLENLTPPTVAEADFLKAMHADPHERLACQCRIMGPVTVQVPPP